MNAVDLGVNLFVTLFALLDPIGNLPIFAAATAGATLRQRISVSALICAFAAVFLAFHIVGKIIIHFNHLIRQGIFSASNYYSIPCP